MSRDLARTPPLGDPTLVGLAALLSLIGLAMIWSAGQVEVPSTATGAWQRQLVWLVVAAVAFYASYRIPSRWLEWLAPWAYAASLALLVTVLFVGTGPATRSWLELGPVRLQPAEPAKLATVLMLARLLSGSEGPGERLVELWKPVVVVLLPLALVLQQPDLGSALIFGVLLVAALYWSGVPLGTLLMLLSPGVSLLLGFSALVWGVWFLLMVGFLFWYRPFLSEGIAVLGANVAGGALTLPIWQHLAPYQQNRLLVFLDPGIDPRGAGWHLLQSKVAIGSGGLTGQGFGEGPQKRLAFLPEQHTDFIFSVAAEELGFLGVAVLLTLLGAFLLRTLRVAREASDEFGSLVVFCLLSVWFTHLLVNVGMTVGLMPITGLPLPFLSYGGSFLVSLAIGLGMVASIAAER